MLLTVLVSIPAPSFSNVAAQDSSCANYDAWIWAQTVYESDKSRFAALDLDGDGIACPDLSIHGFAPLLWTKQIPADAVPAQLGRIVDGDTFHVSIDGVDDAIRMYHMNTPETHSPQQGPECGGDDATNYLAFILQYAPNGIVYLEYDRTQRDQYDRRLAYVWYQIGPDVYMVNEAMVRTGWAESKYFKPDNKYGVELDEAEQFSVQHVLGVRLECGKFGQPLGSRPSKEQLSQARRQQPNQGQFEQFVIAPTEAPWVPAPTQPVGPSRDGCDPSYPTVCIPPYPPDLNCKDISYRRFQVLPPDPHNFDGDGDGIGCERD